MVNIYFTLKPAQKFAQKLRLTPRMKLSIDLLQMPLSKLNQFIKEQAEINPLLDTGNPEKVSSGQNNCSPEDGDWQDYRESLITSPVTLQEHLLRQLHLIADSQEEREIGELIIGDLDDNGYLRCPVEEIAECAKISLPEVKESLSIVQTLDPIGVGARDLRECLLIQIKAIGEEDTLAGQIVDKYLPCLEKKRYKYIAKKLKAPQEKIKESIKRIAKLEPKPGRSFNTECSARLIPDAALRKNEQGYEVIFNDGEFPQININQKYRLMAKEKNTPDEVKEYLRERLEAARSLIEAVKKRKETVRRITEEIVLAQREFLDNGELNFQPLTLEYIARKTGKHKSTVSRAIANKYVQTPWGILELRYFFNSGVKQENGTFLSSKAAKSKVKNLIENEGEPLTDREIADSFKKEGVRISRRTLAKYRMQLGILSSKSRGE